MVVAWEEGCTEPWVGELLCALLKARHAKRVLETGSFTGFTTVQLAQALGPDGELLACDIASLRAGLVQDALEALAPACKWTVFAEDVFKVVEAQPNESLDFVFVDDTHTKEHVDAEIQALLPKVAPGGLICFHDVFGITDLKDVVGRYGGYSIDLPMLGPAGGLGILQCL